MSQSKESVNVDVMGRLMSLEQRTHGLQGRIAAIEARMSETISRDGNYNSGVDEGIEFVAAVPHSGIGPGQSVLDAPLHGPRPMIGPGNDGVCPRRVAPLPPDTTGIAAGAILIGAGLLLYNGNIDLIKNPLLSLGCGIFVILLSLVKSPEVRNILSKNTE